MSHHPPTYSHLVDPLDADDWLKTINKKLIITQCNDWEKVLYASGRLEGAVSDWLDAYTVAHAAADTITWKEFQEAFRTHHISSGMIKLKQKEFLALKQGNMSVSEYKTSSRSCLDMLQMKWTLIQRGKSVSWMVS
jgi:hypothetical protein